MAEGGTVSFACDGTIVLASTVVITNDTILDASGHQITISGNNAVGVFEVGTNVQFSIENLTIANGLATDGAALLNAGGTVNVANSTFCGNRVVGAAAPSYSDTEGESAEGGAVANLGVLRLVNCTFTNNSVVGGAGSDGYYSFGAAGPAGGRGEGGAVCNSGLLLVRGCTFAGNSAVGGTGGRGSGGDMEPYSTPGYPGGPGGDGAGGAVFNCGTAWFVNCTLASNTGTGGAGGPGGPGYDYSPDYPPPSDGPNGPPGLSVGGIYDASGQCYLTNCTVVFNAGVGIWTTNGTPMVNTLLAENSGGNGSGLITDLGHNLSSDTTCAFTNSGSMNNVYALLGPLADYGGSTLTVALLSGCRAIDAGDTAAAPPTDQRGVARPFGSAADIGAYEYSGATNPVPPPVVTECTEAGLRAAMSGGGHVTFACNGIIQLSNTVVITTDTFLDAADHQITIQDHGTRLFQVSPEVTFSMANLVIVGGSAAKGAGILNASGFVNATNCVFSGNAATQGGAIWNSGALVADLCTFSTNSAAGTNGLPGNWYGYSGGSGSDAAGGAIYNLGTLTISRSTFSGNYVFAGSGGEGYFGAHGDPYMYTAQDGGGGGSGGTARGSVLYNPGTARVFSSTFAYNMTGGGGGGAGGHGGVGYVPCNGGNGGTGGSGGAGLGAVFNSGSGSIQIVNSTFAFNLGRPGNGGSGGDGGPGNYGGSGGAGGNGGAAAGALYDAGLPSSCRITNCTFVSNSGAGGTGGSGGDGAIGDYQNGSPGAPGTVGTGYGNVKTTAGEPVNTLLLGNPPAWLGPLADNGGPTLTMALLPGSPAIDAGDTTAAPATDQRGFPRPVGAASDIGAYECNPPQIATAPPNQTAEAESSVDFVVGTFGDPTSGYLWFCNGTNLVACGTNDWWVLTDCDFSQSGSYTVIVSNIFGAVTSAPAMLNVIPPVERRPVPAINLMGDVGTSLNVEYSEALGPPANWLPLDSVNLTNPPQICVDLTSPMPAQRFYRAWQPGTPSVTPSLDLHFVPAIAITGNIGDTLRLDYINAIGPTDAWVTLDTVTLTNTSQLYFDTSSIGQPRRLYRIVPEP